MGSNPIIYVYIFYFLKQLQNTRIVIFYPSKNIVFRQLSVTYFRKKMRTFVRYFVFSIFSIYIYIMTIIFLLLILMFSLLIFVIHIKVVITNIFLMVIITIIFNIINNINIIFHYCSYYYYQ